MYFRHEIADTIESLRKWLKEAREERDDARRWSAAWKLAAKDNKAKLLHAVIKYKLQNRTVKKERDEARRQMELVTQYLGHLRPSMTMKPAGYALIAQDEIKRLRAENARLHDALAQSAAGEVDAVKDAQELQRQLAAEKSLRRKAQLYAARQTGKLYEARGRIAELEAVIADMLDHLTDTLWYPNDDPQVEALRAALRKARGEVNDG